MMYAGHSCYEAENLLTIIIFGMNPVSANTHFDAIRAIVKLTIISILNFTQYRFITKKKQFYQFK